MRARSHRQMLDPVAGYSLGIDLGTTYTAAAVARGDRAEICPLGNRAATIPTIVHYGDDGTFKVGEAALPRAIAAPARVAREFKRRLGDPVPIVLGGTAWSAEALLGEVLRFTADAVAEREGGPPDRIALTHPANWGPYKLDLLTQAVRLAGLKVDRYLSEPEAAAFAYAFAASERLPAESVIAVYDLGGGTFDATVLRTTAEGFEILGNPEGIERLGGIDVDEMVFAHVGAALGDALTELDPTDDSTTTLLARLRTDCVAAKEQLSNDTEVSIPVTLPGVQTEVRLTRAELEAAIAGPLEQTVAALRRALASSNTKPEDLHAVLLVGGTSRIPIVADLVGKALGRPVAVDAHPKHGVAIGAALAARGAVPPQPELELVGVAPPTPATVAAPPAVTRSLAIDPQPSGPSPSAPAAAPALAPAPASASASASVGRGSVASPAASVIEPVIAPPAPPSGGTTRSTKMLVGAVGALAVVAALLGGILLGGGGKAQTVITAAPGAVAPTGTVACPSSSRAAVCIQDIAVQDGRIVVDFAAQQTALARPTDGKFAAGTVHPLFFVDTIGPAEGREWGPTSPFSGEGDLSTGYSPGDIPAGSNLCAVLIDENRQWIPDTGNCVPAPA